MASSPTVHTLKWLRDMGYTADVVEKWIPQAKRRKDLFGFIDIVAMRENEGIVGVQATSYSNVPSRIAKIRAEARSDTWLKCGGKILVVGWKKQSNGRWTCRYEDVSNVQDPEERHHRDRGQGLSG